MSPQESLYFADWLRIAEKDLRRAKRLLGDNDPDMAGFCLQQRAHWETSSRNCPAIS